MVVGVFQHTGAAYPAHGDNEGRAELFRRCDASLVRYLGSYRCRYSRFRVQTGAWRGTRRAGASVTALITKAGGRS